jgi:D-serine deaminase-like pyridoxal phosphate-dependent protein
MNESMIQFQNYRVTNPDALETPAMLLFQDAMEDNIRRVCEMVGGGQNLISHVKTHKSVAVARKQLELGISGFKCATLKELEMVLEAGASKAILSYPQTQEIKIERFCDLTLKYPDAWIATIISSPYHLEVLGKVATRRKQPLRVMLDLDAGMQRTGVKFGTNSEKLYGEINTHPYLEPSGFHLYDGHENHTDLAERAAAAQNHIETLQEFQSKIEEMGIPVPCVVGGGAFSFAYYAHTDGMYGSPGTYVYWDVGYSSAMPDLPFRYAAMVLTQVVDRFPDAGTITTDLGSKAISSDLPVEERAYLLGQNSAKLVMQNEEHGVFRIPGELPRVGDYLLVVPGHVCPTTIRYPGIHVIDNAGEVVNYYLHTSRDRI